MINTKLNFKGVAKKVSTTRLSRHFTLAQFVNSRTAKVKGISNKPQKRVVKNLKLLAINLEKVRGLLGFPIVISSCYRSKALNTAVGGSKTSHHMRGLAVDFRCDRFGTPYRVCKTIAESDIEFDQLIHEYGRLRKDQWVHLGFGPKKRCQILTICASENLYREGLHRFRKKKTKR